jgi:hypothetical protein
LAAENLISPPSGDCPNIGDRHHNQQSVSRTCPPPARSGPGRGHQSRKSARCDLQRSHGSDTVCDREVTHWRGWISLVTTK